jgi:preprotein translocase subunit SecB
MTISNQQSPPEANLRLEDARLTNSSFEFISHMKVGPINLEEQELKVRAKIVRSKKEIHIFIDYRTTAKEQDVALFKLATSYYALFRATLETTSEQLESFAKLNAPAIVFPTMRSCIATLTLAASQPPLTLPIINFQKFNVPVESVE